MVNKTIVYEWFNLISISSILKYFKSKNRNTDYATVSIYLQYLEDAFFIHQSPRIHLKTKELLSGEKKHYLNDLAFRNYLYPMLKTDFAAILENIVYIHLRIAGYEVFTGNIPNSEIDFVAKKNENIIYVQVSYVMESESTILREFAPLEAIKDNFPKYVVSFDEFTIQNSLGIKHLNIWTFIQKLIRKSL